MTRRDIAASPEGAGQIGGYVTVKQAAAFAQTSTRTIKRWIAAGALGAIRLPSPGGRGPLRIRHGDLLAVMAAGGAGIGKLSCFDPDISPLRKT